MALPALVIPDTTPLVFLAAGGALGVLPALGRVIIPDVVQLEATRLPEKPWAKDIAAWLASAPVEIAETELGELYRLAVEQGRKPPRNAGEISIVEWLHGQLAARGTAALVISEDHRVARMLAREALPWPVPVLTTFNLLELAEDRRIILSASAAWRMVVSNAPSAGTLVATGQRKPQP